MMLDLQRRLAAAVKQAVRTAFDADLENPVFQFPPRQEMGDLALTAAFDLARSLRRKPREIAERLAAELTSAPFVRKAEVAGGGYLNLFLDRARVAREIDRHLAERPSAHTEPRRAIVEHTSVNPNKAAHIGHLRNAILGDSLVRLLRHCGHLVGIQNYIDDTGVQVADVVVGFLHLERKSLDEVAAIDGKFDYYCWDLYARVGDFYAEDPSRKQLQTQTLHAIEGGEGTVAELAAHVAARIVDCHLATMERVGIRYDLLVHESDILKQHFWDRAFELLKAARAVRLEAEGKNRGCWVLGMESEGGAGDEDKIIVRSNGTVTYTGKDIAYQLWKLGHLDRSFRFRRHKEYADGHVLWTTDSQRGEADDSLFGHAQTVYNVIDAGQSYPQRVVKAGVAALCGNDVAGGSHHYAYEKVVLSPATARALGYEVSDATATVKVSGRKGLGVKADDLVDLLIAKAENEIEARDPEREPAARNRSAKAIAVGALRYFLLKFGRTKIITFDMEEALAFTGETGPYLQNAVVRARSIFAKLEAEGHSVAGLLEKGRALDLAPLLSGTEGSEVWSLLLLMARTDETVLSAVDAEDVALLAKHAFAVAQAFHSYYQKPAHSVLRAESEDLRAFRTLTVSAFVRQMEIVADLLGIPIPDKM